jgi:1-aminocyclopropane-1-carboxylate deaminase/D-cysteine desulfhydrase-like pyridoxal-dependent ACC family enzyme
MKVLFVYSQNDPKLNKNYSAISQSLENAGNKIVVFKLDNSTSSEQAAKEYQKLIASLKKIDFVVVEGTSPANGIGFLIATAINEKKPVLTLVDSKTKEKREAFWNFASKSKLLTFNEYELKTIEEVISQFNNSVKKVIDTKFILIISPEIDSYLQWASDNRRMHKAQVVRRAVEEVMRNDKEYKKHAVTQKKQ